MMRSTSVPVIVVIAFWLSVLLFFPSVPVALRWPVRVLWFLALGWLVFTAFGTVRATCLTLKKTVFILIVVLLQYICLTLACQIFIVVMSKRDDRLTTRGLAALTPECREGIQAMLSPNGFNVFSRELAGQFAFPTDQSTTRSTSRASAHSRSTPRRQPIRPGDFSASTTRSLSARP